METTESIQSKELYLLNEERIELQNELEVQAEKKLTADKISRIFKYICRGAFHYIRGRIKASVRRDLVNKEFYLRDNYKYPKERIAVYMALYGNYDNIYEPIYVSPNIDYYVFTDMDVSCDSVWKKIDFSDKEFGKLNNRDKNRFFKILPHKFFKEYKYSIYLDSSYQIVTDLVPFVCDMSDSFFSLHRFSSPMFYDQVRTIWALNRASKEAIEEQVNTYKKQGMPNEYAYFWNAILVREHNNKDCITIMEDWWHEFITTSSKRDQVSLPYILWKHGIKLEMIHSMGSDIYKNPRVRYKGHLFDDYKEKK